MSVVEEQLQQPSAPAGPMIRTLVGVAMFSGLLVVLTFHFTKPYIDENQRRAIEAALFQVVPGAVTRRDFVVTEKGVSPATEKKQPGDMRFYAGYDDKGKLLGIAANTRAQGYANLIHLLYGYDPTCQCIRGIKVLKLAETPGLGDKIITDPAFVANFEALDVTLAEDGEALANEIVTVKHGSKQNPWEIDAISGATISSKAVGKALNESAKALLPMLVPHLKVIEAEGEEKMEGETGNM